MQGFLSVIPYSLHEPMEYFYHVILLSIFKMSDFDVEPQFNAS